MKTAYYYHHTTRLYAGNSQVSRTKGYEDYILPQFATLVAPPVFDEMVEQVRFDIESNEWRVEAKSVEVKAYQKLTLEAKVYPDASLVPEDYTLKAPTSQFDKWDNDTNDWQTDLQAQYEAEVQQVTNIRESLYVQIVDRLNNEAKMIRRVEGDETKAAEYEAQADAAYLKIRADYPWPEPPITE
ncbi:hypothetical protein RX455_001425 [Vibrio fluvialis]|nr:hypothetical protein [Vibrio fluvialis]